jgi:hypothetical protein
MIREPDGPEERYRPEDAKSNEERVSEGPSSYDMAIRKSITNAYDSGFRNGIEYMCLVIGTALLMFMLFRKVNESI